jgi:hypothetical protein
MSVGSDCPTGKIQYATKAAAIRAVGPLRGRRGRSLNAFRCSWCTCWHTGNKGGDTAKGRRRRR